MTKRSKDKPYMAGHLEVTVGCMQYGEEPLKSIQRELMEETGIRPNKIELFKTFISHHAIAHTFVAILDMDPDSIVLQKGETDAYYWFKEEEFKRIWQGSLITQVQKTRISPNIEKIIEQIKVMKNER
jgi:8-oxo-dGTP pyrophosphatase MutT (NUDIX family)